LRKHYHSLARKFTSTREAEPRKIGERPWLLIPAADFEGQALKARKMILNGDPRIGRAPEEKRFKPTRKGRI
jgi:hypothetical protein